MDSPIIVNKTADEFYKQPLYYAMGHFRYLSSSLIKGPTFKIFNISFLFRLLSKFINENSKRVKASIQGDTFKGQFSYVVLNDEANRRNTLVMHNQLDQALSYSIFDSFSQKYINAEIGAHTIKSIVWFY